MSDKLIPVLGAATISLIGVYVTLVVATIYFATWQTQGLAQIRDIEGTISSLESEYYAAIAQINRTDPSTYGLAAPVAVRYVTAVNGTNVTFAGR